MNLSEDLLVRTVFRRLQPLPLQLCGLWVSWPTEIIQVGSVLCTSFALGLLEAGSRDSCSLREPTGLASPTDHECPRPSREGTTLKGEKPLEGAFCQSGAQKKDNAPKTFVFWEFDQICPKKTLQRIFWPLNSVNAERVFFGRHFLRPRRSSGKPSPSRVSEAAEVFWQRKKWEKSKSSKVLDGSCFFFQGSKTCSCVFRHASIYCWFPFYFWSLGRLFGNQSLDDPVSNELSTWWWLYTKPHVSLIWLNELRVFRPASPLFLREDGEAVVRFLKGLKLKLSRIWLLMQQVVQEVGNQEEGD